MVSSRWQEISTGKTVFRAIQLVVLMKILCCNFFACSNRHSDVKSLNVNHVADFNLGFLLLFNPLFIGFFDVISILQIALRNVNNLLITDAGCSTQFRRTVGFFINQKFLKCNMSQPFFSAITMRQCHITTFRTFYSSTVASSIILTIYFSSTTI